MQKAELLGQQLSAKKQMLITAESCTGGLIGAACTDVAGSSQWFYGGIISYDNAAKKHLLQVTDTTLMNEGAVSIETVAQMCRGALLHGADISVAVSGVAGPAGGSVDKPVGTVIIGCMCKGSDPQIESFLFDGDRSQIRQKTVLSALEMLLSLTKN